MSASILLLMKTNQSQTMRSNESYAEAGSIVLMAASAIRTVYSLNASQLLIDKYSSATERAYQAAASRVALLGELCALMFASMSCFFFSLVNDVTIFYLYLQNEGLANGMVMGSILFLRSVSCVFCDEMPCFAVSTQLY